MNKHTLTIDWSRKDEFCLNKYFKNYCCHFWAIKKKKSFHFPCNFFDPMVRIKIKWQKITFYLIALEWAFGMSSSTPVKARKVLKCTPTQHCTNKGRSAVASSRNPTIAIPMRGRDVWATDNYLLCLSKTTKTISWHGLPWGTVVSLPPALWHNRQPAEIC